jgi:hypothetical protein
VLADLSEPPPLLLQAGSNEVLLDDSTRLATWAAAAGVDVILDVTADVPHVFQSFTGSLDEADAALDRAGRFIIDRLASAPAAAALPDAGEDVRRRLAGDDVPAHHGAHRGRGIRGAGREPGAAMVGCTYRIRWDRAEIVRSTASP